MIEVDTLGTVRHVSPVSSASASATVKPRPQYYDAKQNLNDEAPSPNSQYNETTTPELILDPDELAKELKRARLDKAELQHALNKIKAEKRSSEAGFTIRISSLNNEIKMLHKERKEGEPMQYSEWKDALLTKSVRGAEPSL
jgi:protease II